MSNDGVAFSRLFSMGGFEALRVIRHFQARHEGLPLPDVLQLIRATDATSLDFEAAFVLDQLVDTGIASDKGVEFYRECIAAIILRRRPIWAKVITLGRQRFATRIARDEHQCFREAGLLVTPATPDVIKWWDTIAAAVRSAITQANVEQARRAEGLTIEHEKRRLCALGIDDEPKWIALDDNTAGYDVLSYDPGAAGLVNRLIEVKSTVLSPLRFELTRNEWDQAARLSARYHFHIWNLAANPPQLFERTVADIRPNVPEDKGRGRWIKVQIPVC